VLTSRFAAQHSACRYYFVSTPPRVAISELRRGRLWLNDESIEEFVGIDDGNNEVGIDVRFTDKLEEQKLMTLKQGQSISALYCCQVWTKMKVRGGQESTYEVQLERAGASVSDRTFVSVD
jgi:hypothetical protein